MTVVAFVTPALASSVLTRAPVNSGPRSLAILAFALLNFCRSQYLVTSDNNCAGARVSTPQ